MYRYSEEIFWEIIRGTKNINESMNQGVFNAFFQRIKLSVLRGIQEKVGVDVSKILENVLEACAGDARKIMLRTLIYEMHISEKSGELVGESDQEKFVYFSETLLCREDYLRELFAEYPSLLEALMQMMEDRMRNICDLVEHFHADIKMLNQYFFPDKPCSTIRSIEGGASDSHRRGRKVYFLKLDNGEQIVYKPRGLAIDSAYEKLISWVYEGIGMKFWWPKSIDRGIYGWSQWVSFESCDTYGDLCDYYRRNGVLLCISYLLGTEDLHYENLIAHGEYPVIIDLEMAVGTKCLKTRYQCAGAIEKIYLDSVLHTGLLPMFVWNENGEGINVSAMNGKGGQLSPIRIPVIVSAGTLNMRVEYRQPVLQNGKNLALLNGEFMEPYEFLESFQDGFETTYRFLLANKKCLEKYLELFEDVDVRYLEKNTQQYAMTLLTSYHPYFLSRNNTRKRALEELHKQNGDSCDVHSQWICHQEIKELCRGDVPYFYVRSTGRDLYSGTGEVYREYFDTTPIENILHRVKRMSLVDLERQKKFIAMALLIGSQESKRNLSKCVVDTKRTITLEDKRIAIARTIGDILLEEAIWSDDGSDVGWISIMMAGYREMGYLIRPANMYLYDGIAGIAVFMAKLACVTGDERYRGMADLLVRKLCAYTDRYQGDDLPAGLLTGAYSGEASIALAYMILYSMGYSNALLGYIKKQCVLVVRELEMDRTYDVIGGNAGALLVFIDAYQLTGDIEYLEYAKQAGDLLLISALRCDAGIGWKGTLTQKPLTGFAHGAAGFMLALLKLGDITQDSRYMEAAYQAFCYEESQYVVSQRNWRDLRYEDSIEMSSSKLAWCHGWGGIVAARIVGMRFAWGEMKEGLEMYADFPVKKKYQIIKDDKYCLCHGKLGNSVLLNVFARHEDAGNLYQQAVNELFASKDRLREVLTMQECDNFGLMGGISGIGYSMLADMDELKYLLCLEDHYKA